MQLLFYCVAGLCTLDQVKVSLARTLKLRFELGLFNPPSSTPYWNVPASAINTTASRENAMLATLESLVLLKNTGSTLPLAPGKTIAVIGPHSKAQVAMAGNYLGQV